LGFLGLGWIGLQRMAAIAASREAEIVALADPLEDSVAKAGELVPEAARLRTLEELLEMEIEGLVIATPSALNASQTVSVLSRGIGIFCQKPLGWHSGTLAAAKQAVLLGTRGIAFSTPVEDIELDFRALEPAVTTVLKLLIQRQKERLLNINIPLGAILQEERHGG
jgi:hypothetical protein